jgi:NADH-quinone oxidoreductase subunit A
MEDAFSAQPRGTESIKTGYENQRGNLNINLFCDENIDHMYWPFLLYFVLVLAMVTAMLVLSFFLGERHRERNTGEPYESGIKPTGSTAIHLSIKFYLVALFFVIFDVESIFIFAWAIAFRRLGWAGYIEIIIFISVVVLTLVYLWRMGALDWGRPRHKNYP